MSIVIEGAKLRKGPGSGPLNAKVFAEVLIPFKSKAISENVDSAIFGEEPNALKLVASMPGFKFPPFTTPSTLLHGAPILAFSVHPLNCVQYVPQHQFIRLYYGLDYKIVEGPEEGRHRE